MTTENTYLAGENLHPDPITGAPGFHPIGTGVGAAGGGLAGAAAGAAIGSVVPGIGTIIGGVVGTIAGAAGGGLAGKAVAENIDPSAEDTFWRKTFSSRPYVEEGVDYDQYAPAYRYGWESRANNPDIPYDQAEPHLEKNWRDNEPRPRLEWDKAKYAVQDAWHRAAADSSRKAGQASSSDQTAPGRTDHSSEVISETFIKAVRVDKSPDVGSSDVASDRTKTTS